jgi:hypothetical protein
VESFVQKLFAVAASIGLLVAGGVITQLTERITERRRFQRAACAAIADLLEVRHTVLALKNTMDRIGGLGAIPTEARAGIRVLVSTIVPNPRELHDRYEKSLNTIAELDPVLAFTLRSKDFGQQALTQLAALAAQDKSSAFFYGHVEQSVSVAMVPALKDAALRLSKVVKKTKEVREALEKQEKEPIAVGELFESMKAVVRMAQAATASGGSTSPSK